MARNRRSTANPALARLALGVFFILPRTVQIAIVIIALVVGAGYVVWKSGSPKNLVLVSQENSRQSLPVEGLRPDGSGEFLFCFWNVENLFDDVDDRRARIDEDYDNPFARDPALRQLKYQRITEALLRVNGGRGPDLIACVEVEGVRAAQLLQESLNSRIAEESWQYRYLAVHDLNAGRHITPAVISRLPISPMRTRLLGFRLRILETEVTVNGHDLRLIVSHWTSQIRQQDGGNGESGRMNYAKTIAEAVRNELSRVPSTDLLVCGDFNDTPDARTVREGLNTTGDRSLLGSMPPGRPLLALFAGKPPERFGTIWHAGHHLIYDQICVTPGMLDRDGWWCDPEAIATETRGLIRPGASRREPWRFGKPLPALAASERGSSDHFPITLPLTVQAAAGP